MKRKLFTSKKIRKHDYACVRDAETRAVRLHVRFLRRDGEYGDPLSPLPMERICRERRLIFRAAFASLRQTCLFGALHPYKGLLLIVETLFIMIVIRRASGALYSWLSVH